MFRYTVGLFYSYLYAHLHVSFSIVHCLLGSARIVAFPVVAFQLLLN